MQYFFFISQWKSLPQYTIILTVNKTERVLPLSHILSPFIHIEKTRYPQYLVFCCLSSFIICNPPDGPPGSYPPDLNNDPVLLPAAVPPQVRSGAPESRFDCIFLQFRPIFSYPRRRTKGCSQSRTGLLPEHGSALCSAVIPRIQLSISVSTAPLKVSIDSKIL